MGAINNTPQGTAHLAADNRATLNNQHDDDSDGSSSAGRIDCYNRGHFVLEAKKQKMGAHTKGFDDGLLRARAQGEGYARTVQHVCRRRGVADHHQQFAPNV